MSSTGAAAPDGRNPSPSPTRRHRENIPQHERSRSQRRVPGLRETLKEGSPSASRTPSVPHSPAHPSHGPTHHPPLRSSVTQDGERRPQAFIARGVILIAGTLRTQSPALPARSPGHSRAAAAGAVPIRFRKCGPGATAAGERGVRSGRAAQRYYMTRRRNPARVPPTPRLIGARRCPPPARRFRQRGVPPGAVSGPRGPRLSEGRTALAPPRRRVGPKSSPGLGPVPQPPGKRA